VTLLGRGDDRLNAQDIGVGGEQGAEQHNGEQQRCHLGVNAPPRSRICLKCWDPASAPTRYAGCVTALAFDLPGLSTASVRRDDAATGVTLLHFADGAACAVDARGGAIAARELQTVALDDAWGAVDALVFTGGSTWGLAAVEGVVERITEERGGPGSFDDVPAVPAAAVWDFTGRSDKRVPDLALGRKAFDALTPGRVSTGRAGAGTNVTVGSYLDDDNAQPSGQGAAFARHAGARVLVVTVINASGNVYSPQGAKLAGGPDVYAAVRAGARAGSQAGNTLLTAVITDVALDRIALRRVAVMSHAAAARMIDPLHTPEDGDVCFALSLARQRMPHELSVGDLGVLAGGLVQEAIANGIAASR
jgi:L-aminopeptidase/D-esterase-like protein